MSPSPAAPRCDHDARLRSIHPRPRRALFAVMLILATLLLLLANPPRVVHGGPMPEPGPIPADPVATKGNGPPALVIKGNHFFDPSAGQRFSIKGIAYQPRYRGDVIDPISNAQRTAWERDLPVIASLGANVVRVYDIDAAAPHDQFMAALADRNMYLLLDMASAKSPLLHVDRSDPHLTVELLDRYLRVVDAFAGYDNVLGFLIGNEVSDSAGTSTRSAAVVRGLVRDVRQYIKVTGKRAIPLGYAASDNAATRIPNMQFYTCGAKDSAVDFYGANIYSWCAANQTFETSGYVDRTKELASLGVPVLLSEFGCNIITPRTFPDVSSIYGPDMDAVVDGAIAYEYTEEDNRYGLVQVASASATNVTLLPDFTNLKNQWSGAKPTPISMNSVKSSTSRPQCPGVDDTWMATASPLPPTPSKCACQKMAVEAGRECRATLPFNWTYTEKAAFLGDLCGKVSCVDLGSADDFASGQYGKYGACSVDAKISWALNAYYEAQKKDATACNFGGKAMVVKNGSAGPTGDDGGAATCVEMIPPEMPGTKAEGGAHDSDGGAGREGMLARAAMTFAVVSVGMIVSS
ncbi:1,3-beta-glucanosyltransferase gas1 [Allomyces arbusculus]|nr:1,3-beta-glucanosyltransferase gas1 [Allomyces arbusculus]